MLVDSSELLIRFQPILIVILILIFVFVFILIYTKILENRIKRNSINCTRRNDEEIGCTNSSDAILPKYVESATHDTAYAPPPYATERDFCHAINSVQSEGVPIGENSGSSRNFEGSAHNVNSNQINSEVRQVAMQLRNIAN